LIKLQKEWFNEGRLRAWYYAAWSQSGRRSSVHHLLILKHVLEKKFEKNMNEKKELNMYNAE
jgi:hypothetical protein